MRANVGERAPSFLLAASLSVVPLSNDLSLNDHLYLSLIVSETLCEVPFENAVIFLKADSV